MADNRKIPNIRWFVFFHKEQVTMTIPSIVFIRMECTGKEFREGPFRRKRIYMEGPILLSSPTCLEGAQPLKEGAGPNR